MKQKKLIIAFGMIIIVLLVFQSGNAQDIQYTKRGYFACPHEWDIFDIKNMLQVKDLEAAEKLRVKARCILLKDDEPVYILLNDPESHGIDSWEEPHRSIPVKFRFQGSTDTYWTFYDALSPHKSSGIIERNKIVIHEWLILKSFLWITPNKTMKQEIIQKYGNPSSREQGDFIYKSNRHPDFKEWKTIKFIFNGSDMVEEIRGEK